MFKKFLLSIAFIAILFINAFSMDFNLSQSYSVQVGSEPAAILYDSLSDTYNVFCIGIDKNFNTVYEPDSGDVLPSWWVLKASEGDIFPYKSNKVLDLEFSSLLPPVRLAFAAQERAVFIPSKGKILQYNIDSHTIIDSINLNPEINYDNYTLDFSENMLLISQSSYFAKSSIVLYSLNEKKKILEKEIGQNIIQSVLYKNPETEELRIATISIGPFGQDSSKLYLLNANDGNIIYEKVIGNNANYIQNYYNKYLIITLMGSHKVIIHNIASGQQYEIQTNTTGWDGPSVAKMFHLNSPFVDKDSNYWLGIATYNSENQIGFLDNQYEFQRINNYLKIEGKIEDFAVATSPLGFCIASVKYLREDYSPNDSVQIDCIDFSTGINETSKNEFMVIYPNPVNNDLFINFNSNLSNSNINLKIYDYLGNIMIEGNYLNVQSNEMKLDVSELPAGSYVVQFYINNIYYTNYFIKF
jgi:hypothetical protein